MGIITERLPMILFRLTYALNLKYPLKLSIFAVVTQKQASGLSLQLRMSLQDLWTKSAIQQNVCPAHFFYTTLQDIVSVCKLFSNF